MTLLELKHVQKTYPDSQNKQVLQDISLTINEGDYVAIMGESGAGKTTLLNIMATLDNPTAGSIKLNGVETTKLSDSKKAVFRRENLGFIFQSFDLLDIFNNRDNIYLPLVLTKAKKKVMDQRLAALAPRLGIQELLDKYPSQISGGQRQRVTAARALITEPALILADEPTGALDSKTAQEMLQIFQEVNAAGQTIVMVTHSSLSASYAKKTLFIRDGRIKTELDRGEMSQEEYLSAISQQLTELTKVGE
ncbi:putative bacteriocin export ABC transporter, lactococcin 972 group [Fructobacillus pseudoficulneus]|uniref:Putative bacteriocin export ABC transporter, lactococcin 972 group n=1 Tax=Fructobacillus pseudoficulneus TaxID=220714 RepID=A0A3F3GTU7_9LACO|nr:ABC transporter ATP-binding protein [Fructobacillus pseudoficulneus]GAP02881.1 putative bacteriocin export ABC transporter, lactococcin 972 group [Fructobacillus pseudoficulneus]SEH45452.1 putative ABC transport system ATP-binding protein [Fructobacillus pseudoficulneus]